MSRRVLVCGGRNFDKTLILVTWLRALHEIDPFSVVIEGGANGADRLARSWASLNDIPVSTYYAHWDLYGKSAGWRRNQQMLDEGKPDLVVAFPGGKGTADMVKRALAYGVRVIRVDGDLADTSTKEGAA